MKPKNQKETAALCSDCAEDINTDVFPDEDRAPEKKRRWPKVLISLAVIASVLVTAAFAVYPKIKMAALGPAGYYLVSEIENVQSIPDPLSTLAKFSNFVQEGELKFKASGTGSDEAFNRLALKFQCASNIRNEKSSGFFTLNHGNKQIADLLIQTLTDRIGVSFPSLTGKKQMVFTADNSCGDLSELIAKMTGMSEKELSAMVNEYSREIVLETLEQEGSAVKGRAEVNGKDRSATTFTVTGKTVKTMIDKLAAKLESDGRITAVYKSILTFEKAENSIDKNAVKKLVKKLRRIPGKDIKNISAEYTVCYDFFGNILSRRLKNGGKEIFTVNTFKKNGKRICEIICPYFSFKNAVAVKNGYAGETTLGIAQAGATLKCVYDFNRAKIGGMPMMIGSASVTLTTGDTTAAAAVTTAKNDGGSYRLTVDTDLIKDGQRRELLIDGNVKVTGIVDFGDIKIRNKTNLTKKDMQTFSKSLKKNAKGTPLSKSVNSILTAIELQQIASELREGDYNPEFMQDITEIPDLGEDFETPDAKAPPKAPTEAQLKEQISDLTDREKLQIFGTTDDGKILDMLKSMSKY